MILLAVLSLALLALLDALCTRRQQDARVEREQALTRADLDRHPLPSPERERAKELN